MNSLVDAAATLASFSNEPDKKYYDLNKKIYHDYPYYDESSLPDTKMCGEINHERDDISHRISRRSTNPQNSRRKLRKNFFPHKLFNILGNPEYNESIRWLHHGKSFVITNQKSFMKEVLPMFFNRSVKIEGFTRKLNRWGFRMVTKGPDCGAYYNKLFERDRPRLCELMVCQKNAWNESQVQSKAGNLAYSEERSIDDNESGKETQPITETPNLHRSQSDYHIRKEHATSSNCEKNDHFYAIATQSIREYQLLQLLESRKRIHMRNLLANAYLFDGTQDKYDLYLSALLEDRNMYTSSQSLVNYQNIILKDAVLALQHNL